MNEVLISNYKYIFFYLLILIYTIFFSLLHTITFRVDIFILIAKLYYIKKINKNYFKYIFYTNKLFKL